MTDEEFTLPLPPSLNLFDSVPRSAIKVENTSVNEFKCDVCGKIFTTLTWLNKHLQLRHGKGEGSLNYKLKQKEKINCDICGKLVKFYHLKDHVKEVHEKVKDHHCEMCDKSFSRSNLLKSHIKISHEKIKNYNCASCDYKSAYLLGLKKHYLLKHTNIKREKNHKCERCGKCFYSLKDLKTHVNEVHENIRNHQCPNCQKWFSRNYILKLHIKNVHENNGKVLNTKSYKCYICDKKFGNDNNLQKHMSTIHHQNMAENCTVANDKNYECNFCEKRFGYSKNLKNHLRKRHGGKMNILPVEKFREFVSSQKINSEKLTAESQNNETDVMESEGIAKIKLKFRKTKSGNQLAQNGMTGLSEDEFHQDVTSFFKKTDKNECEYCEETFESWTQLKKHVSLDHEINTHECDFCGQCLTEFQEHDCHQADGEMNTENSFGAPPPIEKMSKPSKKFTCAFCDKSFDFKANLKTHMIGVHEWPKNFACEFCHMSFSLKGDLKQHIKDVHVQTKCHICDICFSVFSSSGGLEKHTSTEHNYSI